MEVRVIESTDGPEQVVCRAARNDYMEEYGANKPFTEVMEGIEPDSDYMENPEGVDTILSMEDVEIEARKKTLIENLLQHGHFGPFEHPQITFHVKGVSRSLMAQLTRHRHATFDIQSMRYVSFEDADPSPGEAVVSPPELESGGIAGRNAEVSEVYEDWNEEALVNAREREFTAAYGRSFKSYRNLLEMGVAPENARMVLPIGTKVNIVFSVNARMLMHIADMRAAADAQWEIREMTEEVLDLAEEWMPLTFGYYDEEMKNRKNRLSP